MNLYIKKPCRAGNDCCDDCRSTGFAGAAVIDAPDIVDINYSPNAQSIAGLGAVAQPKPSVNWFNYLLLAGVGYYIAKRNKLI